MYRKLVVIGLFAALLLIAVPAQAITNGEPDGTRQQFTSVGYGAYEVTNQPGGHRLLYNDVRMVAVGTLNAINPAWLRISMNPATDNGGTCYGDSGGLNFLGATDVLAATTITGDYVCRATNVVYRLDRPSARAFLGQFVTLP